MRWSTSVCVRTVACSRSTVTRIACTRSGWRKARLSLRSSIALPAGPTPRSWKSTPSLRARRARASGCCRPAFSGGTTLHAFEGFRFAVYPRHGGRAPEFDDPTTLEWMGRFLGRIHAVGARSRSRTGRRSTSPALARSRVTTCSLTRLHPRPTSLAAYTSAVA